MSSESMSAYSKEKIGDKSKKNSSSIVPEICFFIVDQRHPAREEN